MTRAFDDLVKGDKLTEAEKGLRAIEESFGSVIDWATEMGIAVAPLEAARRKLVTDNAQAFVDQIDAMFDPLGVALKQLQKENEARLREAEYIRDTVTDVYVDMAKVAEFNARKVQQLQERFFQGTIAGLDTLIRRLTYGDLGNAAPETTLMGTQAALRAAAAQSRAGDVTATGNLPALLEAFVQAGRTTYASTGQYEAIRREALEIAEERQAALSGGKVTTSGAANDAATNAVLQSNAELREMLAEATRRLVETTAELQRAAVNRR
jgi:hypothetical protein